MILESWCINTSISSPLESNISNACVRTISPNFPLVSLVSHSGNIANLTFIFWLPFPICFSSISVSYTSQYGPCTQILIAGFAAAERKALYKVLLLMVSHLTHSGNLEGKKLC